MNNCSNTGTILDFSARTYMGHECIRTYASNDEKYYANIDVYGVMYSMDGKRLLAASQQLNHYET